MTAKEVKLYLDTMINAASVLRNMAFDDSPIELGYYFCKGIDNQPCIQLFKGVRLIADILGFGVMQKDHDEDYREVGIMYNGWYLFQLEDKEEE